MSACPEDGLQVSNPAHLITSRVLDQAGGLSLNLHCLKSQKLPKFSYPRQKKDRDRGNDRVRRYASLTEELRRLNFLEFSPLFALCLIDGLRAGYLEKHRPVLRRFGGFLSPVHSILLS